MAELQLDDAPRKVREMYGKAYAAVERNNLDYAISMFEAVLELEPRLLQARKWLRAAEIRKFKAAGGGAGKHMLAFLTNLPTYLSAQAKLKKDPSQALKLAEKLIKADPLHPKFITLLAHVAVACELPEVALQILEIGREHDPQNIEIMRWLGRLYRDTNQTKESRLCYEEIARMRPNDPAAIKDLKDAVATDTMRKGGWEEAKSHRDLIKDTKEAQGLEQENKAVKTGQDLDDLIAEFQARIQREPENVNYRRALADHFSRAKRFDEALAVLGEAQTVTGRADPQVDRAISSITVQKFDLAIEQARAEQRTAEAAAQEQAKADFIFENAKDLVKRYPNDLQFHYELGVLFYERGLTLPAIESFQLAQRNPQRRTRALYYLGLCFKQKGQYDIALEQLEKAAAELTLMDDAKKDIVYEMGLLHDLMGQAAKAVERFKEIYGVDIRYKDVAQRIEKAYQR
jgi:tetratricopeptide (TPR) repeat protein